MATIYNQSDLPLCRDDIVVKQILDHGVEVERKLFAGQRVPADLIDAYKTATGEPPAAVTDADADAAADYSKMSAVELQALADQRGVEAGGTGAGGNVVKVDLIAALEADDQAK